MKFDIHTLIRIIQEDAEVSVPEIEDTVEKILGDLGPDAGETVRDAVKNDPKIMDDILKDNPEAVENHLKTADDEVIKNLSSTLEDPDVMSRLADSPDAITAMSSHYADNPEDIPDQLVRQIAQAVAGDKDTPKGDIQEAYEDMLSRYHVDGQPWSGTLQDLASVQGKSWGGGDLVDEKGFDKEVRTSAKFATGTAKSPLKMTERRLRKLVRNILVEARSW